MKTLIFIVLLILHFSSYAQIFTVYHGERGYLAVDSANNIWAETSGSIKMFDGNTWTTVSDSCIKPYTGITIPFVIDIHSNIWTYNGAVHKYNTETGSCNIFQLTLDTFPSQIFSKMTADRFGNLWFLTEYTSVTYSATGLYEIAQDSVFQRVQFISNESPGEIISDNDGNIWFATYNNYENAGKFYEYKNNSLINIIGGCGNPSAVDTNNHIWSGVGEFDGTVCISHNVTGSCINAIAPFSVNSLVVDQNNIKWFGTTKGLIRYDGVNCTVYDTTNSDIPQMNVSKLLIDKENNLWFNSSKSSIGEYNIVKACGLIDTCLTVVSPKLQTPSPKLQIYPNPTGNNIKISIPAGSKEPDVSIYNISGSEVFKEKYKANEIEINTENFPKGVYLIKVNSGGEVFNEKVVIN